ncbi:MAG: YggS family pyridoxal phosphate-dependent enzyme [Saprospiraceae bacterium]|nr:YggS family pyridoxal phosphate-dependent enzyme [Saprospiraceae bacterium]
MMYKEILAYTSGHSVTLVAVSKTKPAEDIMKLYQSGQRIFGENKVQEMVSKYEVLPNDIQWHQIGHLQKNKVKYIAPFVAMIHAVDSFELLEVINKEAVKNIRTIDVLLQFHIATEETKFGLHKDEAVQLLTALEKEPLLNVRICGVMGMASFTEDTNLIRSEFRSLKEIFTSLKSRFFMENPFFNEISMGMSGDYKIAIEEGSTMVRIGSAIFGER